MTVAGVLLVVGISWPCRRASGSRARFSQETEEELARIEASDEAATPLHAQPTRG